MAAIDTAIISYHPDKQKVKDMTEDCTNVTTSDPLHAMLAYKLGWQESEITDHLHLENELSVDSLDLMEIEIGVEEYFGVRIPTDELQSVKTVGDLRVSIKALVAKKNCSLCFPLSCQK